MASYPYGQLTDGEQLLIHQHPHWKLLVLPAAVGAAVLVSCCYLAALAASHSWRDVAWVALAIVGGGLLIRLFLAPWLRWKTTHFVVTTDKIMFREGVLRRAGINIPLKRIASIRYEHDFNDRIFGCGTLIVEGMSDEPLTFTDIPNVEQVHNLLYQAINGDAESLPLVAC